MKIALFNSCRYLGGAEFWQVRFAKFLRESGDEVRFFLRPGKFSELVRKEGFALQEPAMRFDLDLLSLGQIWMGLREFSPDVVLFNDQRDLRLGVIAAGLAGVPLKLQRKGWSFLKGSARDRFYYNRLDAVACVSHDIEKLFADKLQTPENRLLYLPNGVSPDRFANQDKSILRKQINAADDYIVIGMSGRLEKQKRQADLIRASKFLVRRGHKVKVVLAGEGRERAALESVAAELNLKEVVTFLGFVDKMEDFYAGLDVFVFCSEWEGMPNAVLEAMASGRPVIAADIPVVSELIEDGKSGLIYPARNVADLAELIERVIRDPEFAAKLGQAATERVSQHFDERKIMAGFQGWLKARRDSK